MAHYHFHVHDGKEHPDEEGTDLASLEEAQHHAIRTLGDLCRENPTQFWRDEGLAIRVTNHTGLSLFSLHVTVVRSAALWRDSQS